MGKGCNLAAELENGYLKACKMKKRFSGSCKMEKTGFKTGK